MGFVPNPIDALALVAVVAAAWLAESRSQGWAFTAAAVAIGSVVGIHLLRAVPPGHGVQHQRRLQPHRRQLGQPLLHADGHDRGRRSCFPFVLLYQGWSLYIFRKRLVAPPSGTAEEEVTTAGSPTHSVGTCGTDVRRSSANSWEANVALHDHFTISVDGESVDDEDADRDVRQRPDRVVRHPPDGADGHHGPGEYPEPSTEL